MKNLQCTITYAGDLTQTLAENPCPHQLDKEGNTQLIFNFDQHDRIEELLTNLDPFVSESIDRTGLILRSKWKIVSPKKPNKTGVKKKIETTLDPSDPYP